jgi:hypothetical protein
MCFHMERSNEQTDGEINLVWAGQPHPLRVGWRNYFSAVLETFLQPINAQWVYGT